MTNPAPLDLRNRDAAFDALGARTFDLAVIGGGITGAGIARDAAMRGLSVALIEERDVASGTSSRSSKMIHGGLRYLAQGDLALVREAASERKIVQAIAPYLARETPFVLPARNAAAIAKLRAGLWTFEKLGGVPKSRKHEVWSQADLAAREPTLKSDRLAGAVVYPEYLTDDARLTLANVRSAAANGATVLNYAVAAALVLDNGQARAIDVVDTLPGADGRRARLTARTIVNAAGPWVDAVRALEDGAATPRLTLAKGVHLVIARPRLPVDRTIIFPAADRRSLFAVPRGATTYIGTTDTLYPRHDLWPTVTGEDVDYLLEASAGHFAIPPLSRVDVVSIWSGVRPLVHEDGKSTADTSRRDEVWTGPGGVLSVAGGKLTAYRKMAQRVVDTVETALGRKISACRTADAALVGGDGPPPGAGTDPAVEAAYAVVSKGALTLEDYWIRRSARAWFDLDGGMAALEVAAATMAPLLGWSPARAAAEIAGCRTVRAGLMAAVGA